jgi:hypothetical protein
VLEAEAAAKQAALDAGATVEAPAIADSAIQAEAMAISAAAHAGTSVDSILHTTEEETVRRIPTITITTLITRMHYNCHTGRG